MTRFLVARAVVPHMFETGRGKIINISVNESTMRRKGFIPYGPSRAATDALSSIMAADLAGTGIDVNLLLPGGVTRTGMTPEAAPAAMQATWLDPAIMGPPTCWLASRATDGITGLRITATEFNEPSPSSLRPRSRRVTGYLIPPGIFPSPGLPRESGCHPGVTAVSRRQGAL
jgi:NAD(P)-dependent dehydrogenase (short-subunit alcohol dehydrogenase family)